MDNSLNSYLSLLEVSSFEESIFIAEKNGFSIFYVFNFNNMKSSILNNDFHIFIYPTEKKSYLENVFLIGKSNKEFFGQIKNKESGFFIKEKKSLYYNKKSNFSTITKALTLQKKFYDFIPYNKEDFIQKFCLNTNLLRDINKKNINQYLSLANNVSLEDFYEIISTIHESKSSLNVLSEEEKDLFQLNNDISLNFQIKEYIKVNNEEEKNNFVTLIKNKFLRK